MASNVRLVDTVNSYVVQGWEVEKIQVELRTYQDVMPLATLGPDKTFLMDYGGRERTINLSGLFTEGKALGTGTGMTVTALEDQISAFESKFINYTSYATDQFELRIYDTAAALKQTYKGMPSSFQVNRVAPTYYTFQFSFTEGELV